MGYYDPQKPAIVPDGFLSLGVERITRAGGRLSYVIWHEGKIPLLALEFVSKNYGREYKNKLDEYARISIKYYVIYNPEYYKRDNHQPFEVYLLVNGQYVLQQQEPFWIAEIGLGIGRGQGTYRAWHREWLYWYDHNGNRIAALEEIIDQERQRVARMQAQLQQMGVEVEQI